MSGFTFFSNFDSGNLASVEPVPADLHPLHGLPEVTEEMPTEKGGTLTPADYSFRIWTRPDCSGKKLHRLHFVLNLEQYLEKNDTTLCNVLVAN